MKKFGLAITVIGIIIFLFFSFGKKQKILRNFETIKKVNIKLATSSDSLLNDFNSKLAQKSPTGYKELDALAGKLDLFKIERYRVYGDSSRPGIAY